MNARLHTLNSAQLAVTLNIDIFSLVPTKVICDLATYGFPCAI